jgi:hypothetical protein
LGFNSHLLEWLTELREAFTYVYQGIVRDIAKDTDEQAGGGLHRARSMGRDVMPPSPHHTVNNLEAPALHGTFIEVSSHKNGQLTQSPTSRGGRWGGTESSK